MMQGFGVYQWRDGRRYEGEYHQNKKHGKGNYIYSDGSLFEGAWKNGQQHGLGFLTDGSTGQRRKGEWVNGDRKRWIT